MSAAEFDAVAAARALNDELERKMSQSQVRHFLFFALRAQGRVEERWFQPTSRIFFRELTCSTLLHVLLLLLFSKFWARGFKKSSLRRTSS